MGHHAPLQAVGALDALRAAVISSGSLAVHDVAHAGILWAFCCVVDMLPEQCIRRRPRANPLVVAVLSTTQDVLPGKALRRGARDNRRSARLASVDSLRARPRISGVTHRGALLAWCPGCGVDRPWSRVGHQVRWRRADRWVAFRASRLANAGCQGWRLKAAMQAFLG